MYKKNISRSGYKRDDEDFGIEMKKYILGIVLTISISINVIFVYTELYIHYITKNPISIKQSELYSDGGGHICKQVN